MVTIGGICPGDGQPELGVDPGVVGQVSEASFAESVDRLGRAGVVVVRTVVVLDGEQWIDPDCLERPREHLPAGATVGTERGV